MKRFLLVLLLCLFTELISAEEIRALWITRWDYTTPTHVEQIINNAYDYHFNYLLFQVRGNATVFYQSSLEPWAWELTGSDPSTLGTDPGWNPLAYAIQLAHQKGLELHAYMNTYPCWRGTIAPPPSFPQIYNDHPDWFCVNSSGTTQTLNSGYITASPGIPDAQDHIYAVYIEVADNYDVDGFHYDYVRYPSSNYSWDGPSLQRFFDEYGGTPATMPSEWSDWRRQQVTDLVDRIHNTMQVTHPGMTISGATWASYSSGYSSYFQDSWGWLAQKILDVSHPMTYTSSVSTFTNWITQHIPNSSDRFVSPGIGAHNIGDADTILEELELTRYYGAEGFTIFAYSSLFPGHSPNYKALALLNGPMQFTDPPVPRRWKYRFGDDDDRGPRIFEFSTDPAYPTLGDPFYIQCRITDPSGVYDDDTGPEGQGVHLRWALNQSPRQSSDIVKMSLDVGDSYKADSTLTISSSDDTLYYQVTAWDNDYDGADADDRTSRTTAILSIGFTIAPTPTPTPPPGSGIIVDNDDGSPAYEETGTWTTSSSSGWNGGTYRYVFAGEPATATWTGNLPDTGDYYCSTMFRQSANRVTAAKFIIQASDGDHTVYINQNGTNTIVERYLGTFPFDAGDNSITLDAEASTPVEDAVIADAVRFIFVATPTPTPSPTVLPPPTPTASPTPTPTPTSTPTPTASPTPIKKYEFEPCPEGWTFQTVSPTAAHVSHWDHASSLCLASAIGISSPYDESTNYFALWDSLVADSIPCSTDSLYQTSWYFSTDRGSTNAAPSFRFRTGLTNQKAFSYSRVYPGDWLPLAQYPNLTSYTLFFEPPIASDGLFLAFSLIDWTDDFRGTMPAGSIYLDEVSVYRHELASLTNWQTESIIFDPDTCTTSCSPAYDPPTFSHSAASVSLTSGIGSDRVFGAWDTPHVLFTAEQSKVYRLKSNVSASPSLGGPDLRLRIHTDDYRYAWYTYYVSSYTPGESALPSETGEDCHLYLTLPFTSQPCHMSCDLIDFSSSFGGTLTLHALSLNSHPF